MTFIKPMLAAPMPKSRKVTDFRGWVVEEKFDGHRLIVEVAPFGVTAWSRLGNVKTLPQRLHDALDRMADGVYDGELIVRGGQSWDVSSGGDHNLEVVLFDAIAVLGKPITSLPLSTRRQYLEIAGANVTSGVHIAPQLPLAEATVERIYERGGEGVMLKDPASLYRPGFRSVEWLKVKQVQEGTGVIVGFERGTTREFTIARVGPMSGEGVTRDFTIKVQDANVVQNHTAYLGHRVEYLYQMATPEGSPRHPRWKRLVGAE